MHRRRQLADIGWDFRADGSLTSEKPHVWGFCCVGDTGDYAATWVAERGLKPRTRSEYTRMLDNCAALDRHRLDEITRDMVEAWFTGLTLATKREGSWTRGSMATPVGEGRVQASAAKPTISTTLTINKAGPNIAPTAIATSTSSVHASRT